jgi:ATP-binding cassette subfamily B (MDR/TAP) protein 6
MISWQILYGPWDGKGQPDAASFVVFLMYLQQLYGPLDRLGMLYRQLNSNATDAEKLFNLLAQKTEIRDSPDAEELVVTDGVIEFDKVCFSYDKEVQALKNVSFRIGKGESMALVGESGSGKSTILRLLYRFYDIDSGTIRIDGQDISKVTQQSLRRAIGIVPQDSVLWNDTIGANISYGKEGANDDEIIAAAKAAKLHDRILSFADGYSTVVGERGVRLSGGEKQRVSLARMFLKSPAILVLDEATSALDTETEREIQKALAELAEGRSSLSIAHRLSTVINSDQIVVMKDGSVIEHGSYRELLNIGGHFSRM